VKADISLDASLTIDPDGNIMNYHWDFGNGVSANGVTVDYTYPHSGTYSVVLSATDNAGATTKLVKTVVVNTPGSDAEAIQQVVSRFFILLADVEFRSAQEICSDFSLDPSCPARDKQIKDIQDAQPTIEWFDVQFLSDVSVHFVSQTQAFPVRVRNLLRVKYFGDPKVHFTDGWHQYTMQKESDGQWHQCRYTFELVAEQ
jgi:PKD repeat protein